MSSHSWAEKKIHLNEKMHTALIDSYFYLESCLASLGYFSRFLLDQSHTSTEECVRLRKSTRINSTVQSLPFSFVRINKFNYRISCLPCLELVVTPRTLTELCSLAHEIINLFMVAGENRTRPHELLMTS